MATEVFTHNYILSFFYENEIDPLLLWSSLWAELTAPSVPTPAVETS